MAEQTEVGIVDGVPTSGTGEVPTLAPVRDAILAGNALLTTVDADTSVLASLSKAEDTAHSDGHTGVMALAVRKDTSSTGIGANGDYVPLAVDASGRVYVTAPLLEALISSGALLVKLDPSTVNANSRAAADDSAPVVLSDEDFALLTSAEGAAWAGTTVLQEAIDGQYETVAASQTNQVLGPTGATGDLLTAVLIVPATTSPGNVIILDNATSITIFTGGSDSVSNLVPFRVDLGMRSVSGSWRVTTGANVSAVGIGNFT